MTPLSLARRHAALVEQHLPGLLVGVYLVGSASSGDHHHGRSDVDTVAVVRRPLGTRDADALRAVHDALAPEAVGTAYDTTYVPAGWLAAPPREEAVTPFSLDGVLHLGEPAFAVNPVTWVELEEATVVSGPPTSALGVADVRGPLREWTMRNLRSYWAPSAARVREVLSGRPTDQEAAAEVVVWHVLGAPRLHATLATGRVVSKTAAGDHAAATWPQHAALCRRAQAWRAGDDVRFTTADGLEAADLVDAVVRGSAALLGPEREATTGA